MGEARAAQGRGPAERGGGGRGGKGRAAPGAAPKHRDRRDQRGVRLSWSSGSWSGTALGRLAGAAGAQRPAHRRPPRARMPGGLIRCRGWFHRHRRRTGALRQGTGQEARRGRGFVQHPDPPARMHPRREAPGATHGRTAPRGAEGAEAWHAGQGQGAAGNHVRETALTAAYRGSKGKFQKMIPGPLSFMAAESAKP